MQVVVRNPTRSAHYTYKPEELEEIRAILKQYGSVTVAARETGMDKNRLYTAAVYLGLHKKNGRNTVRVFRLRGGEILITQITRRK